jgi:nucleolar protein 9
MHPNGSHVIEAVMSSRTVSDTVKQRTVRKLRDHVDTLAADKFGSHIVDKCWSLATTELREKIVERLIGVKTRLEDNPYGRMVLRNCHAYEFEKDAQNWKNAEESAERKKSMFAEILEDSTNDLLPESLQVDASNKRSKRKPKNPQSNLLPQELKVKKKKKVH